MKKENIHIIATGGTIDSKFNPSTESTKVKPQSGIPDFINNIIQPHFTFSFEQLVMVDSSEITDSIRAEIISKIENSSANKIIILHGTNTMVETLNYLEENNHNKEKIIFLTGSMIPLDGFTPTDAGFNLGFAIGTILNHINGNFIAMNGKIFSPKAVKKNFDIGRFESYS